MRVVFDKTDLIKILNKHFGVQVTADNVKILTDPFGIDIRNIEELPPLSTPPAPKNTVAEELKNILTLAAEQVSAEASKQGEVLMPESAPSPTTFSIDQLLDPTVSRHSAEGDAPPPKKREPLPPLPKLNDYFGNDDTDDGDDNVHYNDPGETTPAEIEAARRQRKGGR